MSRSDAIAALATIVVALGGCDRLTVASERAAPPPRQYMEGGAWFPAETGYWFHQ